MQSKTGFNLQVEICVEVDEQVERCVRCAHFRRADGDKQQISRGVLRTVSEGTRHCWSKLLGLVDNHVEEEGTSQIGGG